MINLSAMIDLLPYSMYYPPMGGPLKCELKEGGGRMQCSIRPLQRVANVQSDFKLNGSYRKVRWSYLA